MVEKFSDFMIKSIGCKRNNDIPLLADAMVFFLNELFKKKKQNLFSLDITLVDTIVNNDSDLELRGECSYYELPSKKKHFNIKLAQDNPANELVDTLAHEIVHLHQIVTGKLKFDSSGWYWKGAFIGSGTPYTHTESDYFNLPWEVEADLKQRLLCKKFYADMYKNW